ncbi:MAG: PH domain-containing protein [Candidatus Thorarchaeota archaeon]
MASGNGLNSDEQAILTEKCSFIDEVGRERSGDLVITQSRLIFLKSAGLFGSGRERLHAIDYESIRGIRIETPGWIGARLCIDYETPIGVETSKYKVSGAQAQSLKQEILRTMGPIVPKPSMAPFSTEPAVIRETVIKEVTLVVCPHCGHRNESSRRHCEKCGASI